MIDLDGLLAPGCVRWGAVAASRKAVMDLGADLLARAHRSLSAPTLSGALMKREQLGSTGLGSGIAIPHCRFNCEHLKGALLTLAKPVNFHAEDGQWVDLLFVLVAPTGEATAHLEALSWLAHLFDDSRTCAGLRAAGSDDELRRRFVQGVHGVVM